METNILILDFNKNKALSVIGAEKATSMANFYFCEWSSTLFRRSGDRWEEVSSSIDIKFDLVLRHGTDKISALKNVGIKIKDTTPWIVFSGGGYDHLKTKDATQKKEHVIIRGINPNKPITITEWQKILRELKKPDNSSIINLPFIYSPSSTLDEQSSEVGDTNWVNNLRPLRNSTKSVVLFTNKSAIKSSLKGTRHLEIKEASDYKEIMEYFNDLEEYPDFIAIPVELLKLGLTVELIKELRLSGINSVIIFIATNTSKEQFRENDRFDCLAVPGHKYYDIRNGTPEELEDILNRSKPLSDLLLLEIQRFHFDPNGKFRELAHNLRSNFRAETVPQERVIEHFFQQLVKFFSATTQTTEIRKSIEPIKKELLDLVRGARYEIPELIATIDPIIEKLYKTLFSEDETQEARQEKLANWEVIFIEDSDYQSEKIIDIAKMGHLNFKLFKNGEEALKQIKEDKTEKIKVVVADWRLKESDEITWQEYQGIDVLSKIYTELKRKDIALFVLTDRKGRVMEQIMVAQVLPIYWYLKDDVFSVKTHQQALVQRIKEEGNNRNKLRFNEPKGTGWRNPRSGHNPSSLWEYYTTIFHNSTIDSSFVRDYVSENAKLILDHIIHDEDLPEYFEINYRLRINKSAEEILSDFREGIEPEENYLKRFLDRMVGRLVYLTLSRNDNTLDRRDILKKMHPNDKDISPTKESDLLYCLAIKHDDKTLKASDNALAEEKEWINNYLQIEPANNLDTINASIQQYFESLYYNPRVVPHRGQIALTSPILNKLEWMKTISKKPIGFLATNKLDLMKISVLKEINALLKKGRNLTGEEKAFLDKVKEQLE